MEYIGIYRNNTPMKVHSLTTSVNACLCYIIKVNVMVDKTHSLDYYENR